MSDPIADLLTRIRNASRAEHEKVDIPSSKLKVRITEILKDEGFIKNFRLIEDKQAGHAARLPQVRAGQREDHLRPGPGVEARPARLRGQGQDPAASWAGWESRSSPPPRGVMTDRAVRKQQLGGEVLAYVW